MIDFIELSDGKRIILYIEENCVMCHAEGIHASKLETATEILKEAGFEHPKHEALYMNASKFESIQYPGDF